MTNEFQANNKTNIQANQENLQKASEAKTVVNGKVVSVKDAQAAEQQARQAALRTGIQAHQDNNTDAVQAGQMASGASMNQAQETLNIKQVNVQSGQAHLDQQMNQAQQGMTEQEHIQQQLQKQAQQAQVQVKAAAKTTKKVD